MCSTPRQGAPRHEYHLARVRTLADQHRKLLAMRTRSGDLWTSTEYRQARDLCETIAAHQRVLARTSSTESEFRRWQWASNRTEDTAVRHGLAADLADFAASLVVEGRCF